MKQNIVALIAGLLFGLGLAVSQMIDPQRVQGFLDVAGIWDPTLLFVLGGAVGVTVIAFRFVLRRPAPFLAPQFYVTSLRSIDRPLILGSAIFGMGWAISGYCPGPGIVSLTLGTGNAILFVASMIAGFWLYSWVTDLLRERSAENAPQSAAQNADGARA
jgi:hypothetical protein